MQECWSEAPTALIAVSVPLFLLFAAVELSCVLRPGDSILPDQGDELLLFFRSRMLAVGYCRFF